MDNHREEEGLLDWLDGPRLVVGAFAFFLLGLTVLGILLWSDQREHTERLDVLVMRSVSEEKTAKIEQVNNCFSRAAQGPALLRVLAALERELDDPRGRREIRSFKAFSALNTPTYRECRLLAARLNVPLPKGVR